MPISKKQLATKTKIFYKKLAILKKKTTVIFANLEQETAQKQIKNIKNKISKL